MVLFLGWDLGCRGLRFSILFFLVDLMQEENIEPSHQGDCKGTNSLHLPNCLGTACTLSAG